MIKAQDSLSIAASVFYGIKDDRRASRSMAWGITVLACAAAIGFKTRTAVAQTRASDAAKPNLQVVVDLSLGTTTIGALTESLAKQSGFKVEADECLRSHQLVVQIHSLTAASSLDSLCEMNEWQWREDVPGHIRITRKSQRVPVTIPEIATALRANLPRDYRNFMERTTLAALDERGKQAIARAASLRDLGLPEPPELSDVRVGIAKAVAATAAKKVFQIYDRSNAGQEAIDIAGLKPKEREQIMEAVVLAALVGLCDEPVCLGRVTGYLEDPATAQVFLHGGGIMVGKVVNNQKHRGHTGFGASIEPNPQETPPGSPPKP